MRSTLLGAALLCGVALPAHAATYTCNDTHSNWTLVLQPHVTNEVDKASFWEERANSSMHTGSYINDNNGTTVFLDNGWIKLNPINVGDWSLGSASGAISCTLRASPVTPPAPVAMPAPTPVAAPAPVATPAPAPVNRSIALVSTTGGFDEQVAVNLGSQAVIMLLDTGATSGTVTQSIADALIAAGEASYGAKGKVTLANGAEIDEQTLVIKTVAIGGHQLHDVRLGVTPDGAMSLLGMNVLRQFGRFTIDTDKNQLILG